MEIKLIKNINEFISIVKLIENMNHETNLFINDNMSIRVVDESNIMLVNVTIKKEFFDVFNNDTEVGFGLNFNIVNKIVNSMKSGFTLKENEESLLFKGNKIKRTIKKYVVVKQDKPAVPKDHKFLYKINTDELMSILKLSSEVSSVIKLEEQEGFKLYTKSPFEELEKDLTVDYIDNKGPQHMWLSGEHLLKLEPLKDIFKEIVFGIDEDKNFYFTGETDNIKIEGWLAPRVDDEETN